MEPQALDPLTQIVHKTDHEIRNGFFPTVANWINTTDLKAVQFDTETRPSDASETSHGFLWVLPLVRGIKPYTLDDLHRSKIRLALAFHLFVDVGTEGQIDCASITVSIGRIDHHSYIANRDLLFNPNWLTPDLAAAIIKECKDVRSHYDLYTHCQNALERFSEIPQMSDLPAHPSRAASLPTQVGLATESKERK